MEMRHWAPGLGDWKAVGAPHKSSAQQLANHLRGEGKETGE